MLLHAVTIFVSAFLLFQVEPVIAKMILPWFGGASAVWTACMLFFQAALLLGYGYAHWLHERLSPRRQAMLHSVLLAVSLFTLPIVPAAWWRPDGSADPSLRIFGLLAATVGLPYLLLSATSPLLQAWHARLHRTTVPYRLFALSNLASLLALLSYPPLVEPNFPVRTQARAWSGAYVLFALLCAGAAWRAARAKGPEAVPAPAREGLPAPRWTLRLLWIALAACASILFLAVTSTLTQDVAPIPFLWIVPLSLYLLSFVLCFDRPDVYRRSLFMPLLAAALPVMVWLSWNSGKPSLHLPLAILVFSSALFVACMVCHGELARLKPPPRYLTLFYVMVSTGGVVGGVLTGIIAPSLFPSDYEFPIGLGLCATLAAYLLARDISHRFSQALLAAGLAGFLFFAVYAKYSDSLGYLYVGRNFYGRLAVYDNNEIGETRFARVLVHGGINHGQQLLYPGQRRTPVAYFCAESGIGRALRGRPDDTPWRVGILGMGSGSLAVFGREGDTLRLYEINPLVPQLANRWFTYLKDTPAKVETRLGDGRLLLEREPDQHFDLLVMDAFSGDSVPVHLVTLEAFRTYFRHLKPGGILAVNITNRYLDLRPVMERAAFAFDRTAWGFETLDGDGDGLCFASNWVLMFDRAHARALPPLLAESAEALDPAPRFRPWTDDFSNLLSVLH